MSSELSPANQWTYFLFRDSAPLMNLAEARDVTLNLMEKHGLVGCPEDRRSAARHLGIDGVNRVAYSGPEWRFEFDGAVRRFGQCNHRDKVISLSRRLVVLNGEEQVRETILHEVAHALAGPKAHHNLRWKTIARSIGAMDERCYSDQTVTQPPARYHVQCCGIIYKRWRRPHPKSRYCCPRCRSRVIWKPVSEPTVTQPTMVERVIQQIRLF